MNGKFDSESRGKTRGEMCQVLIIQTSIGRRSVRDVVWPAPRVGEIGWPMKVRRLGRLGLDSSRQIAVAVQVAAVEESMKIAAADGRAQEVLQIHHENCECLLLIFERER